jgi:hypothetical protein
MRSLRILAFVTIAISCVSCWACSRSVAVDNPSTSSSKKISRDFETKVHALKELPLPKAISLVQESSIKKGEGGHFIYPSSMSTDKDGNILIADNNGHAINSYSAKARETTVLPTPPGDGALRFPIAIRKAQQKIYVIDDEGIKTFKEDGQLEKLLRTYYSMWDFVLGPDGSIYANTAFKDPTASEGLIVKLNPHGERVSSFGQRLNHSQYRGMDDRVHLSCSWPLLFVAFRHRSTVGVYDLTKEQFVREFGIQHPVFSRLEALSKDESFTNPSATTTALPRYIAGITVVNDRVFVLLHLPHVEIVEFDFLGNEKNRFRNPEITSVLDYFGLGVYEESGSRKFYVGVSGVSGDEESPFLTRFAVASAN